MKTFRVGTFCEPGSKSVLCYTLWYNREWANCIEYTVEAANGTEAKKKAKALRKARESASSPRSTR